MNSIASFRSCNPVQIPLSKNENPPENHGSEYASRDATHEYEKRKRNPTTSQPVSYRDSSTTKRRHNSYLFFRLHTCTEYCQTSPISPTDALFRDSLRSFSLDSTDRPLSEERKYCNYVSMLSLLAYSFAPKVQIMRSLVYVLSEHLKFLI